MICHHFRCIFVHVPRCAGQSIEHVFLKLLGLNWETRAPLLLRFNDTPELGPPRLAHLKAREYVQCKYVPSWQFEEYFKFSFVRNPWERMVSIYKYQHRWRKKSHGFKNFLLGEFKNKIWHRKQWFVAPQSDFVCNDEGEIIVDFLGRFENLQIDFNHACQQIGVPATELPHVNTSTMNESKLVRHPGNFFKRRSADVGRETTPRHKNYRDHYDDESREFVARVYKRDIDLFEYEFDK